MFGGSDSDSVDLMDFDAMAQKQKEKQKAGEPDKSKSDQQPNSVDADKTMNASGQLPLPSAEDMHVQRLQRLH